MDLKQEDTSDRSEARKQISRLSIIEILEQTFLSAECSEINIKMFTEY